jgi:hexosaminidase
MIAIIPQPVHVEPQKGYFTMDTRTVILTDDHSFQEAREVRRILSVITGYDLQVCTGERPGTKSIEIHVGPSYRDLGEEGYQLTATPEKVYIRAPHTSGLFYGAQTFMQLLKLNDEHDRSADTFHVPCVDIRDYPRFSWRGAMLDVSRHFMPPEFLKKFIDLLAMHKLNTLHIHLTDDQGWRIEIKKYPKLTEVGAWREETLIGHRLDTPQRFDGIPHGGYYTQVTLREIVKYAEDRHITIVPEIDMPGHTQAAIASYPALGTTTENVSVSTTWGISKNILNPSEETIRFMQDVIEEVLQLFPSNYIHLGGDEVDPEQWRCDPYVQARMEALNLKDEKELYGFFMLRMADFLRKHNRRLVAWDEILEGKPAKEIVVMSWRGFEGGMEAARRGNDVVMTPKEWTYFDTYQSADRLQEPLAIGGHLPLDKVYSFEPIPEGLSTDEASHILGAQGQLWTEYMPNDRHVEYMAFPRLSALAEVLWTPKEGRDYESFLRRLQPCLRRLKSLGVNYHPGVLMEG